MAANGKQNFKQTVALVTQRINRNSRVRFSIDSGYREIVEAIVYSGQFPYMFPCDFYRDAVCTEIDRLARDEHISDLVTKYKAELDTKLLCEAQRYNSMREILREQVDGYLALGFNRKARKHVREILALTRNQHRTPARDYFLQRVQEEWNSLINCAHYPAGRPYEPRRSTAVDWKMDDE